MLVLSFRSMSARIAKVAVPGSQQRRPLGSNILHALIPLLGAGNEAVLSAGKDTPVGVRIRCLLECIRNAKQYLGLALMVCSKTKAMPDPASQKASKTRFPTFAQL